MKKTKPIKLRWHLVVLIVATLVPLLLFAAILIQQQIKQQQANAHRGLHDTARALSLAVDREMLSARAVLETLEGSQSLEEGNFQRFHHLAAAAATKRENSRIILFALDGQQLVNTARPYGVPLPNPFQQGQPQGMHRLYPDLVVGGTDHLKRVIETGQPTIADAFVSLTMRRPAVSIALPVKRNGKLLYILDITFELGTFTKVLLEQGLPAGSEGVIVDRRGVIIAHTSAPERFVGRRAPAPLLAQMAASKEGVFSDVTDASTALYFIRSESTGWSTGIAISQVAAKAALQRTYNVLIGGAIMLLSLSLAAALFLGGRLARSLARLAGTAGAIQRGEPIELAHSTVYEIDELHQQLAQAGTLARQSFHERSLRIEAEARRAAAEIARSAIVEREAKLQESEERMRAFLENSATIAWMVDQDGRYVYLSRNYLKRFGLEGQQWQNKTIYDLWPAAVAERLRRKDLAVLAQGGLQEEIEETRNPDGSRSWWFNSRFVLSDRSSKRYVGSLAVDITERKRLEDELENRIAELKQADRRKDEFLAMLSHELRNPLAPISNAVQILKTIATKDSKLDWCSNLIDQQVKYMARLMEDLLDVSRITRDKLDLRKQPVELGEIIANAVETSRPLIDNGGHRLAVDLPRQKIVLDGDPARLTQIFANLLNNAAKYMESNGEISITARLTASGETGGEGNGRLELMDVRVKNPNAESIDEVVISVADTGIGIAPDKLPHVFDMFYQAESGRDRRFGGLGIGLTLVRNMVELHGGSIEAKSPGPGKGSEFIVRLPVLKVELPASDKTAERLPLPAAASSKRVVIVDDNKMQAQTLAMLLETLGYQVRTAYDGARALDVIAAFLPQVALIDIGLPGMNGYELASRLRELPQLNGITLIAQTGWGRDEDREESTHRGFQHHLTKPIDHQLLEKILREVLD
jgi:PAS domain S-box-containing protein